jgi:hypothetical protein
VRILHPPVQEPSQLSEWMSVFFTVGFVRLWHAVNGLYMCVCRGHRHANLLVSRSLTVHFTGSWEFFATLDYEWDVLRGRRQYLRTIWVRS